jgi:hypothetical protein
MGHHGGMGVRDRLRGAAGDVVASAQVGLSKNQAKRQADEMFKVLGQAYYAHFRGRATLDEVDALAAGMHERMVPIEQQLGPVPFPHPLPHPHPPADRAGEPPDDPGPPTTPYPAGG